MPELRGNKRSSPVLVLASTPSLLRACDELGMEVTLLEANTSGSGQSGTQPQHRILHCRTLDDVEHVLAILERNKVDVSQYRAIFTAEEEAMVTAAVLADLADASGLPLQVALRFRDKALQKQLVRAAGVPTADWVVLEGDREEMASAAASMRYPAVLKPIAGTRTSGVSIVGTANEALGCVARSDSPDVMMLEQLIVGSEWHISGWVRDGRLRGYTVARYSRNALWALDEDAWASIYFHPEDDVEAYERAAECAKLALPALGLVNGVFHLEAFDRGGRLVFSECAARPPGLNLPSAIELLLGVDLYRVLVHSWIGVAVDEPPSSERPPAVATVDVAPRTGTLIAGPTEDELISLHGVDDAEVFWNPGTCAPSPGGRYMPHARLLITGANRAEVEERLKRLSSWFRRRVVVSDASSA